MPANLGRKRKERTRTLEEEENCRQTKRENSKIDVSFSKRRKGLFGKAARLCHDFNDTRMAVLVVSKASRPYAFGHSSVDEVLNELYHIKPTTAKSVEGLNLLKQLQEQKKVRGVKEEIENEMMACQTVEALASLREKYLKLDEDIKENLRNCSYEEASFEGGVIDQKYNIDSFKVEDEGRSLGSRHESSFHNLLSSGGEGCCFGLEHRDATTVITSESLLASTESNYGGRDGDLTMNSAFDGNGCTLGLWHDVGDNSLGVPTTGISNNSWLASTDYSVNDGSLELNLGLGHEVGGNSLPGLATSISGNSLSSTADNYGVDGGIRLNGGTNCNGYSLGLWHEANDHFLRNSSTDSGHALLASTTNNYGVDGDLRLNGDIDAEGYSLGLWYDGGNNNPLRDSPADTIGHVLLASATSNDGFDGALRSNGDINIAHGYSLGLWHEDSKNPLRDSTADTTGNVLLASTTSNSGNGGGSRSNGDTKAEGCSLGLELEVNDNSTENFSTAGFNSGAFDVSPLAWSYSLANRAWDRVESSPEFLQSNTNKGYYSYLMEEDIDGDPCSYQDSCNFSF